MPAEQQERALQLLSEDALRGARSLEPDAPDREKEEEEAVTGDASELRGRLAGAVRDLSQCEAALRVANETLQHYQQRFQRVGAAMQMLHEEHSAAVASWDAERRALREQLVQAAPPPTAPAEGGGAEDEPARLRREAVALRAELGQLARRFHVAETERAALSQRQTRAATDRADVEQALRLRIAELSRARDGASQQAVQLAQRMLGWVPRAALVGLARAHALLRRQHSRLVADCAVAGAERFSSEETARELAMQRAQTAAVEDEVAALRRQLAAHQTALDKAGAELRIATHARPGSGLVRAVLLRSVSRVDCAQERRPQRARRRRTRQSCWPGSGPLNCASKTLPSGRNASSGS